MAKQVLNHGTVPEDGTGDSLFTTFSKCKGNFDELYQFDTDLGSASAGKGASLVAIEDSGGDYTATDMEAALGELITKIAAATAAHAATLVATTTGNGAALVGVESGTGFTAANVQAALEELDSAHDAWVSLITGTNGALVVGVLDSPGHFTATNVELVLAELATTKAALADLAATTNGNGASLIGIEDTAGNFTATTVEGALAELQSDTTTTGAMASSISLQYDFSGALAELPSNAGAVRLHAFSDCLIEFGDSSVQTTDYSLFFAAGTEVLGVPTGATHIAVAPLGEAGALNIVGLDQDKGEELTTNAMLEVKGGSTSVALPAGTRARLFALTDCYINFGAANVIADETSMFFEAGTETMAVPASATHIAVARYATDGGLYISGVQ